MRFLPDSEADAIILARQDDNQSPAGTETLTHANPRISSPCVRRYEYIHTTTELNDYCGSRAQSTAHHHRSPCQKTDSDLNRVGITLQPTDRIFTDIRLLGPVVYKLRTVCASLKYSMWHLSETARLYPDPTVRITQIPPPVPTSAALPVV